MLKSNVRAHNAEAAELDREGCTHDLQSSESSSSRVHWVPTWTLAAPGGHWGLLRCPLLTPELLGDKVSHSQHFKNLFEQTNGSLN